MVVLPPVVVAITLGGVWLFALAIVLLVVAVLEFCRLMNRMEFRPAPSFALAMLVVIMVDAQWPRWGVLVPGLSLVILGSLAWQLRHRQGSPLNDWALGMAMPLYIGWCGGHLLRLRALPGGVWWTITALSTIWLADSGAYAVGRAWGKHKLAPSLSPGKTWEGYLGGVAVGTAGAAALSALWRVWGGAAAPSPWEGLLLGFLVASLAPLGDLVVSMIKRQAGVKDTGVIFPGHGGALDRIDSSLWAVVIAYYLSYLGI